MTAAIEARDLTRTFGTHRALDGFHLSVPAGTVFGLLGRNGAGKTTAVRVLATLLRADSGSAFVDGLDVRKQAAEVRRRIGVCGQATTIDEHLTGAENLIMIGRLYHLGRRESRLRAADLLDRFDLSRVADRAVRTYSGGMRRRLDLAGALIGRPSVLFLDEPTTGLDPAGRRAMWTELTALVQTGVTALLTTQYLEEADQAADRIAVVDAGRVVVEGTASELKRMVAGDRVSLTLADDEQLAPAARLLAPVGAGPIDVDRARCTLGLPVRDGADALVDVVLALAGGGIRPVDVAVVRPTLDDVFHVLTSGGERRERTEVPA